MRFYLGQSEEPAKLWADFLAVPKSLVAVDTETPSLSNRQLLGIGVALDTLNAFYVTVDDPDFTRLMAVLRDSHIRKVYHNAPFDLRVLREWQPDIWNIEDTAIMCRLRGESAVLEEASYWAADPPGSLTTETAAALLQRYSVKSMDKLSPEVLANKCMHDCQCTYMLYEKYKLDNAGYYEKERRHLGILETVSRKGIKIDQQRRQELADWYSSNLQYLRQLAANYGFNPGSNPEVGYILSSRGHALRPTKSGKQPQVNADTLLMLSDPMADLVLLYRNMQKMHSTYLEPWEGQERAYTTFHMEAATGRISSTSAGDNNPDRNLQNLPKKAELKFVPAIRSIFVPDDSKFTKADDSQVELRVLSVMAQDRKMLSVFADPNGDIHRTTALEMEIHRDLAKIFNFAMVYGADETVIAPKVRVRDLNRVKRWINSWMRTYPDAARWMIVQQEEGLRNGYVETMGGRRMRLPIEMGEKHVRNCAVNYPIQGTAAEIFKEQLWAIRDRLDWMRMLIHDENVLEGHHVLPAGLEDLTPVHVPVNVEYVKRLG